MSLTFSQVDSIEHDQVWPRDADHRYRLYARVGDDLRVLAAAPDGGGIGVAIVTLDEDARAANPDGRLCDEGRLGVLDVLGGDGGKGRWIVPLWDRGGKA